MSWRRLLVWLLAAEAALLSFDALRAYALGFPPLAGGVLPERTILPRPWLAAMWAVEVDLAAAVGILGIRRNRRDGWAWATFICAAVASVGFQVFTLPAVAARAVPPVALFLAIVVLELPRPTVRPSWDPTPPPPPPPPPADPDDDEPAQPEEPAQPAQRRPSYSTVLDPAQHAEVVRRATQGQKAAQITREMGLSDRARKYRVGPLVKQVAQNGSRPGGGS